MLELLPSFEPHRGGTPTARTSYRKPDARSAGSSRAKTAGAPPTLRTTSQRHPRLNQADLCSLGVEPGDAVHQRRLTRARGTHDGGEAAGGELDSHAVQRAYFVLAAAVDLDGVVDPSGRRGRVEKSWAVASAGRGSE